MLSTINMTNCKFDVDRYTSADDFNKFYQNFGLDGIELMFVGDDTTIPSNLSKANIIGVHINCLSSWIDIWLENTHELIKEYGSLEECKKNTGCITPQDLINKYQKELDTAQNIGAKYVVFHVSDVTLDEAIHYNQRYSDTEIISACADLINTLTENRNYTFDFLCENLWWAGMNFRDPHITKEMMDKLNYANKGIMLDTGHLMHLNNDLETQEQAVDYILNILSNHEDLLSYIKGIHLHQSLTGKYVKNNLKNPIELSGNYNEKMNSIMMYIYQIDSHKAFETSSAKNIIEKINPKYLTHELISSSREEHYNLLQTQINAVK